jgi:hypothetical protein
MKEASPHYISTEVAGSGAAIACRVVRGLRKGLTEDERYRVADDAVDLLKLYGG